MRTTEPLIHTASGPPHLGDAAVEIVPLISTVFAAGPPVLLMWLGTVLFALLIAGPFLLIVTIVVALVAVAGLVTLAAAILASPYLLIRHLRRHAAAQREHVSEGNGSRVPACASRLSPAAEGVHLLRRPSAVAGHRSFLESLEDRVGVS